MNLHNFIHLSVRNNVFVMERLVILIVAQRQAVDTG